VVISPGLDGEANGNFIEKRRIGSPCAKVVADRKYEFTGTWCGIGKQWRVAAAVGIGEGVGEEFAIAVEPDADAIGRIAGNRVEHVSCEFSHRPQGEQMAGRDARSVKFRLKHFREPPDGSGWGMPPPQKGYTVINHHDVQYRWIMQNRRGVNELVVYANAPVNGQMLVAELPRVVSWTMVTDAIDFGNANGWKPNDEGTPFRCKHTRRGFQLEEV
jgi:hypothetical protein